MLILVQLTEAINLSIEPLFKHTKHETNITIVID